MTNRFQKALDIIDPGACNPTGIARILVEMCDECNREGGGSQRDPAVRLVVQQLAYVCHADSSMDLDEYRKLVDECRSRVPKALTSDALKEGMTLIATGNGPDCLVEGQKYVVERGDDCFFVRCREERATKHHLGGAIPGLRFPREGEL